MAQSMAASMPLEDPLPLQPRTFRPTRLAPGATPRPSALPSPSPAMIPATWVPWPPSSNGVPWAGGAGQPLTAPMKFRNAMTLPPSSVGCLASMPVSITATVMSFLP